MVHTGQYCVRFIFLKCHLHHFASLLKNPECLTTHQQDKAQLLCTWNPPPTWAQWTLALPVIPKQHSVLGELISQVLPMSPDLTPSMSHSGYDPFSQSKLYWAQSSVFSDGSWGNLTTPKVNNYRSVSLEDKRKQDNWEEHLGLLLPKVSANFARNCWDTEMLSRTFDNCKKRH